MSLLEKYRNWRDNKRLLKIQEDLEDRQVSLVEATFQTIDGESVSYKQWVRLNELLNGLKSFNELELLDRSITVGNTSYNTKNIVKLESKVIKEGYIKPEVKEAEDDGSSFSTWAFRRYCSEKHVEMIVDIFN